MVALIASLGAILAAYPFVASLRWSERAEATLPRIKIPVLKESTFSYVAHPRGQGLRVLFLRQSNGSLHAFELPVWKDRIALGSPDWLQRDGSCARLEPDFALREIRCMDQPADSSAAERFRWDLDGKTLTTHSRTPDMMRLPGRQDGDDWVLFARR